MNRELSSPEIETQLRLEQLKTEYLESKRWADYGMQKGFPDLVEVMEQRAKEAVDQIVQIDPSFPQKLAEIVDQSFAGEAEELNRQQYDKRDYTDGS